MYKFEGCETPWSALGKLWIQESRWRSSSLALKAEKYVEPKMSIPIQVWVQRQENIDIPDWRQRQNSLFLHRFVLFRHSRDWTRPTHIEEGNLPYSDYQFNVSLIQKPHRYQEYCDWLKLPLSWTLNIFKHQNKQQR